MNGAITTFDFIGESSDNGLQISGEGKKAGELISISMKDNKSTEVTKIGVTFNPSDAKTGFYISQTSVSNVIDVRQTHDSDRSTYSIFGVSLDSDEQKVVSDGIHHSLKEVVEINVIEVLGKLVNPTFITYKTLN
jgi:hypothetical protein